MINYLSFNQKFLLCIITHLIIATIVFKLFVSSSLGVPGDTLFYLFITDEWFLKQKIAYSHGIAILPFIALLIIHSNKEPGIFGDARFSYEWEVKKHIQNNKTGLFLCYLGRLKVIVKGPFHQLINAETRAGKGISFVIPTIFTWHDSAVIFDLKGELYKLTSWFKKASGHKVYYLNFMSRDGFSDCNNIFDYMPDDRNERISFVQKVAEFIQPTPSSGDPMWSGEARSLFTGLSLLAYSIPSLNASFGEIYRLLHTEEATHIFVQNMIDEYSDILDPICKMELWSYIQTPEKTRGGIKKQLTASLKIFSNPTVDAATANSSFDLRQLKKQKMTIYVSTPVDYLEAVAPVVRMFYQFAIDLNLKEPVEHDKKSNFLINLFSKKQNKKGHNCLFLLDEFLAIGYMGVIANKIAYMAGYGLQLMLIIQSRAQLIREYKEAATAIEENCVIRSYLTPNLRKTSEELSNELGSTTVSRVTSRSKDWLGIFPDNEHRSDVKKPLMLPEELIRLPDDKCIVFIKGIWPILGKRAISFKDKEFRKKIKPPIKKRKLDIKMHDVIGGPDNKKTIEVDLDNFDLGEVNTEVKLSDEEVKQKCTTYFEKMGINL